MICTGTETALISSFVRREGWAVEMQSTRFLPVAIVKVRRVADGPRFQGMLIPLAPSWNTAQPPQQKPMAPILLKPCSVFNDLAQLSILGKVTSLL